MIRVVVVFVLMMLNVSLLSSQNINTDSLNELIAKSSPDNFNYWSAKVDLAHHFVYRDLVKATQIIDSVIFNFNNKDLSFEIPADYHRHFLIKAWTSHGNQKLDDAIFFLEKTDSIVELYGDRKSRIEIDINLASLYVSTQDSKAMNFVDNYLAQVDTSLNRNEKIAWIQGKKYKGDIYKSQLLFDLSFNEYNEVIKSKVLDEIKNYQSGIIKGICDLARISGNNRLANQYLQDIIDDPNLFTYENNSIKLCLALNHQSQGEFYKAKNYAKAVLNSDNLNNNLKFEALLLLSEVAMVEEDVDAVDANIKDLSRILNEVQDQNFKSRYNLLKAEFLIEKNKKAKALELLAQATKLSSEQELQKSKLILQAKVSKTHKNDLKNFLNTHASFYQQKEETRINELMVLHETDKVKQKSIDLENNLYQVKKINKQKNYLILLTGLLSILLLIIAYLRRKNLHIAEKYNYILQEKNKKLSEEKSELVFLNAELKTINQALSIEKQKKNVKQDIKVKLKSQDKFYIFEREQIEYLIAEDGGVRLHYAGQSVWLDFTLKKILLLIGDSFIQTHKSYVVNSKRISCVNQKSLTMFNENQIPIGRKYKSEIINKLS